MMIRDAVQDYVKDNERQWSNDRTQTVGASDVGQCIRKVWCLKFENEPGMQTFRDPDYEETWGARWRGNLIEAHLLVPAIAKAFGGKAKLLGSAQQTFYDGYCSATPDCLIETPGEPIVIEFKSIDPRVRLEEPKPEHVYQAQMQMGILRAKTKWQPTHAIISYTDASFLNETKEFIVTFDEQMYEAGKKRAARVMTAETMHELEPEGYIAGGKECEYCPFTRACGVSRRRIPEEHEVTELDPQLLAELSDQARKLKYVEESIALAEKQKRELQFEIKERLREKKLRRVVGDGISISWLPVKGRDSPDMPALASALESKGLDIMDYIRAGEPGDRLTVTLKSARQAA